MNIRWCQIRIMTNDDPRPWNQIPAIDIGIDDNGSITDEQQCARAAGYAQHYADYTPNAVEARWDWQGSQQGHYIWPRSRQ